MLDEAEASASAALTMRDVTARLGEWPREVRVAVEATPAERLIPFSIHAKPPPTRLGQGRIICVGDAAHAMEPNLGQGGCLAIEDAVALGAAAQAGPPGEMLARFERLRLKRVRQFVRLSAEARLLAQPRSPVLGAAMRAMVSVIPESITTWRVASLHRLPDYAAMAARG